MEPSSESSSDDYFEDEPLPKERTSGLLDVEASSGDDSGKVGPKNQDSDHYDEQKYKEELAGFISHKERTVDTQELLGLHGQTKRDRGRPAINQLVQRFGIVEKEQERELYDFVEEKEHVIAERPIDPKNSSNLKNSVSLVS